MTLIYTIGTWRVSRSSYLAQLNKLGVQRLIDLRDNPHAGRQEELKRSKGLEQALASVGITYDYRGQELGEAVLETKTMDVEKLVKTARAETICLLGHLHEPQGCHRLRVSDALLKAGMEVVHLLWKDHLEVRQMSHAEVASAAAKVLAFFQEHKERAEAARISRVGESLLGKLTVVTWEDFDMKHFTDGHAYRFLLPFHTELLWYPNWLSRQEADLLETTVHENVTFLHPTYMFQEPSGGFVKTLIKRGQVRICGDDCPGAIASEPLKHWSESLLRQVEDSAGVAFNCFVANHYANGRVVINWHSDSGPGDDEGLGPNPSIGSLSLGATRGFSLKSKRPHQGRIIHLDIPLSHGSMLVMGNNSQTHWLHCLPADENCNKPRINLTFRFYARESTKHIEGMEHNHEWEAAPGSTRVLLHRDGFGRPIFVDVPDDMVAKDMPRHLSTVLPGHRGAADVFVWEAGAWLLLPADKFVSLAAKTGKSCYTNAPAWHPKIRITPRRSQNSRSGQVSGYPGTGQPAGQPRNPQSGRWRPRGSGHAGLPRKGA